MANLNTTVRARLLQGKEPFIYNLSMPLAGTEYSQALSSGTKKLMIRMRTKARAQIAFAMGASGTLFFTIEPGCVYSEENLDLEGATIYIQSTAASQIAEILEWK